MRDQGGECCDLPQLGIWASAITVQTKRIPRFSERASFAFEAASARHPLAEPTQSPSPVELDLGVYDARLQGSKVYFW